MTVSSRRIDSKLSGTHRRTGGRLTAPIASGSESHACSRTIEARGGFAFSHAVGFVTTKTSITANYRTQENSKCLIQGAWWNLVAPFGATVANIEAWYTNETLHASQHSHVKTGLEPFPTGQCNYIMQIRYTLATGDPVWLPAANHYYWIETIDEDGNGGLFWDVVDEHGASIPS